MIRLNKNIKFFLNYFFGPVVFIWLSFSIYHQIKNQPDLAASITGFQNILHESENWKLCMALLLMMINWGVEARKFQVLLQPVEPVSWSKACRAILTGIAFSISTPNRIGEYPGKILFVKEGNRMKALSLIIVGNVSQLTVTLLAGFGGLIFLLYSHDSATAVLHTRSYFRWMHASISIAGIMAFVGLLTYFRLGSVIELAGKIPVFTKVMAYTTVIKEMSYRMLLRVFSLSFIRYLIFGAQYIFLLQLMHVNVSVWQAFWLICIIFLVLSVIPTIAFAELGIRGQISLELFGLYSHNRFGIIAASLGIWGINLLIPAVIGSLLILRIKIFNSK